MKNTDSPVSIANRRIQARQHVMAFVVNGEVTVNDKTGRKKVPKVPKVLEVLNDWLTTERVRALRYRRHPLTAKSIYALVDLPAQTAKDESYAV